MKRRDDELARALSDAMSETDRDVLLASSGELGWGRRLSLGRRLARDPEARRLADCLSALSRATRGVRDARPSIGRRLVPLGAAFSAAILGGLGWLGVRSFVASGTAIWRPRSITVSEPMFRSSGRLLLASTILDESPSIGAEARSSSRTFAPRIPVRSRPGALHTFAVDRKDTRR